MTYPPGEPPRPPPPPPAPFGAPRKNWLSQLSGPQAALIITLVLVVIIGLCCLTPLLFAGADMMQHPLPTPTR